MPSLKEKYIAMRQLHESGCFVIPNPWDVGSTRYLQSLGFKALATTSSGAAWSMGAPDNYLSLAHALPIARWVRGWPVPASDAPAAGEGAANGLLAKLLLISRVTYHSTALCRSANTPLWKYGAVSAMLRSVGTLKAPHRLMTRARSGRAPPSAGSVTNGPHNPRS